MVALPEIKSPTALAMDAAREAAQTPRDGYRLAASAMGLECDRALWYGFRWVSDPKRFEGQMLRLFEDGNLGEDQIVRDLRAAGFAVVDRDQNGKQLGVSFADGHGYGYLDGEIAGIPEAPVAVHVLEIKTHKAESWRAVKKHGVAAKKPDHVVQMTLYMHKRNRTRALYVYKNKDTSEVETQRIEYDAAEAMRIEARAERIAFADRPPAKLHEDPEAKAAFACKFCDHLAVCHQAKPSRRNCRTCIYVTPVRGGKWVCDRANHELDREAQGRACEHHLLIPDLVHGQQVDADIGAGWIDYAMPDGTTWRDVAGVDHG